VGLQSSGYAVPWTNQGTNFPVHGHLFDAASDEAAFFYFTAFNYGSGNLTVDLEWYADTAASGDVVFTAALAAITPDTDTQDIETKAFATANTVTDSHLGTTNQRLHRATITVSNLDSIAARDWCCLRVTRDADNGSDTLTGDVMLTKVVVSYSDT
jgi:hypothetical protein